MCPLWFLGCPLLFCPRQGRARAENQEGGLPLREAEKQTGGTHVGGGFTYSDIKYSFTVI